MTRAINFLCVILMFWFLLSCEEKTNAPLVLTYEVTSITTISAVSGGEVQDDGGDAITVKGVCWSTADNPTVDNFKTSDGGGTTSFTSSLSDLEPGTMYYIRAYATNSAGTGYGESVSFTTLGDEPSATSNEATGITINTATINGSINPNSLSTEVSFEWGVSTDYGNTGTPEQSPAIGSEQVSVSLDLVDLSPGTTYHYRIVAENEIGRSVGEDVSFTTYSIEDADQNYYHSVTIGAQTWMKENLKTTKYNDNSDISIVTDNTGWSELTTPACSWYENDSENKDFYGALYNWYAVETGKLCPSGWHVPDNTEWATLISYLGGATEAGGKLKEINTTHWQSPNTGATDESGFTALPGGNRDLSGPFFELERHGYWWSSEVASITNAWYTHLSYDTPDAIQIDYNKKMGFSVRCIKD